MTTKIIPRDRLMLKNTFHQI